VRLHVGEAAAEQLLGAIAGQVLDLVVVSLAISSIVVACRCASLRRISVTAGSRVSSSSSIDTDMASRLDAAAAAVGVVLLMVLTS
jgi:hypothetical protein